MARLTWLAWSWRRWWTPDRLCRWQIEWRRGHEHTKLLVCIPQSVVLVSQLSDLVFPDLCLFDSHSFVLSQLPVDPLDLDGILLELVDPSLNVCNGAA